MDKYIQKKIEFHHQRGYSLDQILETELDPNDELIPHFTRIYNELYPSTDLISPDTGTENSENTEAVEPINWRYGQRETFNNWESNLKSLNKYWGVIIAPTGWGKSFMTLVMIGAFLKQRRAQNVLYLTKRKDILDDQFNDAVFKQRVEKLAQLGFYPKSCADKIYNMFDNSVLTHKINNLALDQSDRKSVYIFNVDKLKIGGKNMEWLLKQNIGMLVFDEMHWTGAEGIYEVIKTLKQTIPFGIGFSATPVRVMQENQRRTFELFGNGQDLEILSEITYVEAWQNNIILPVKHLYFPISNDELTLNTNNDDDEQMAYDEYSKVRYKISNTGLVQMLSTASAEIWEKKLFYRKAICYFSSRTELLDFYEKIKAGVFNSIPMIQDCWNSKNIHMSFSFQKSGTIANKLAQLGISQDNVIRGIPNHKKSCYSSLLFVVGQAIEGFDNYNSEMVVEMYYCNNRNPLVTLQKIGRTSRIDPTNPDNKPCGYYVCPVKYDDKRELCQQIANLTNDYLSAVGAEHNLDDDQHENLNIKQKLGNLTDDIIEQSLYLPLNFEITADDILSEIRCLGYRLIKTSKGIARFCRDNQITNRDEYWRFINQTGNPYQLRDSPAEYTGFNWQLVLDPERKIYYSTRDICIAHSREVELKFNERLQANPNDPELKELAKIRKYKKIKFLNLLDSYIPSMTLDEFYGITKI